jgi:hypothetical protein
MKFKNMSVVAAVAALVLSAWGNVAAAQQVTGSASGRWGVVDTTTKLAKGTMFDAFAKPLYNVELKLYGRPSGGVVTGTVSPLPRPSLAIFTMAGNYVLAPDGDTYVAANLMLAIPVNGVPMIIMVGNFDAVLHPTPPVLGFNYPVPIVTGGHFHARWWHL